MSLDDILLALASADRRNLVDYFIESDSSEFTTNKIHDDLNYDRSDQIKLHHFHLPKLDEYGVVNYDDPEVEYTENPELEDVVESLEY